MTIEEIRKLVAECLPLRVPRFSDEPPRERVSRLEDYMLESAYQHGALVEARHWLRHLERNLGDQIAVLQGWEAMLPPKRGSGARTKTEIQAAKAAAAPELFAAGREARALRGSVDDQIERFKFEDQIVISRVYTMISGS